MFKKAALGSAAALALAMLAGNASAAQIFSYGGDYVSANQNFVWPNGLTLQQDANYGGNASINDSRIYTNLNETTPILANSADYTGPSIYGAIDMYEHDVTSDPTSNSTYLRIRSSGNPDPIQLQSNFSHAGKKAGVVVFMQSSFLNGADTQGASWNDLGGSLSLSWTDEAGYIQESRFVVKNAGSYYVSQDIWYPGNQGAGVKTYVLSDPGSKLWASYNPVTGQVLFTGSEFSSVQFNDIEAVGYLQQGTNPSGSAAWQSRVTQFMVDANAGTYAVPEPGMLGIAGLAGLGLMRRRR